MLLARKDVCALLQVEIDKLGLPVKVAALVNDTVGTLMARSYTSTGKYRSILGAIFGTGTNGAYIEKTSNIKKKIVGDYDTSTGEMVINAEWGSFDNQLNVLPNTPWDQTLDRDSVNPGIQMFEKRVSGMFLGEIVRLAVVDLIKDEKTLLFKNPDVAAAGGSILEQWGLDSAVMSAAAKDESADLSNLKQELSILLNGFVPTTEDAQTFKAVSYAVGRRAARLSAVALGAIALQSGKVQDPKEEVIDIGVDGSLVEHYPQFREMIYEALESIKEIGPQGAKKIRIGIAKDGSGVGAALIALIADRSSKTSQAIANEKIKKELESIPTEAGSIFSYSNLVTGGILAAAAASAAFWWGRQRR
uniref:Phosphotransferase n=1 Tax=Bionectria ochroleuca TaxID=29856 RepID=A0A8H7NJJ8_BIOOC